MGAAENGSQIRRSKRVTGQNLLNVGVAARAAAAVGVVRFLSPLRGWFTFLFEPTACAVGCILSPLCGWAVAVGRVFTIMRIYFFLSVLWNQCARKIWFAKSVV